MHDDSELRGRLVTLFGPGPEPVSADEAMSRVADHPLGAIPRRVPAHASHTAPQRDDLAWSGGRFGRCARPRVRTRIRVNLKTGQADEFDTSHLASDQLQRASSVDPYKLAREASERVGIADRPLFRISCRRLLFSSPQSTERLSSVHQ